MLVNLVPRISIIVLAGTVAAARWAAALRAPHATRRSMLMFATR